MYQKLFLSFSIVTSGLQYASTPTKDSVCKDGDISPFMDQYRPTEPSPLDRLHAVSSAESLLQEEQARYLQAFKAAAKAADNEGAERINFDEDTTSAPCNSQTEQLDISQSEERLSATACFALSAQEEQKRHAIQQSFEAAMSNIPKRMKKQKNDDRARHGNALAQKAKKQ